MKIEIRGDDNNMSEQSLYRPHGQSKIWTEPHLLVVQSRGPWNRELIKAASKTVLNEAATFNGAPWYVLGIIYGDGLHTPDAFEEMVKSLNDQQRAGRKGTALVLVDVGITGFFRNYFAKMYGTAGEPVEFFADEESARAWLESVIADLD